MGSQIKSHINHTSLAREEGDEADLLGQEEVAQEATEVRDGRGSRANSEVQEVDSPVEEGSRGESSIRVLPPRDPECRVKRKTKTKTDVIIVTSEVTSQQNAQRKAKAQAPKPQEGKKFEDYTYAYSGAEEPQLATATALPQAYEDALTAMRQSLKNQDPLHSLNM